MPTPAIDLAYRIEKAETVDNHDDNNTIAVNSLGRPTTTSGGLFADEFPFDQVSGAFNHSFFGLTVGMVLFAREKGAGDFRSETGSVDLRHQEVWLRVAEVVDTTIAGTGVSFDLGLEDAAGRIGWIGSAAVGGVPRPFARPGQSKTMLSTLRFNPPHCIGRRAELDLREIVAIHLRPTTGDARPFAFDDLQLVPV